MNNYFALSFELELLIQEKQKVFKELEKRVQSYRKERKEIDTQLEEVGLLDKLMNEIDKVGFKETKLYQTITTKMEIPDINALMFKKQELDVFFDEIEHINNGYMNRYRLSDESHDLKEFLRSYETTLRDMKRLRLMKYIVQENYKVIQFSGVSVFGTRFFGHLKGIRVGSNHYETDVVINLMLQELFGQTHYPNKLLLSYNWNDYNGAGDVRMSIKLSSNVDEAEEKLSTKDGMLAAIDSLQDNIQRSAESFKFSQQYKDDDQLASYWAQYSKSLDAFADIEKDEYKRLLKEVADDFRLIEVAYFQGKANEEKV